MALTKCKDCGESISRRARACPKCGAPRKQSAGVLGYSVVILFGLMILGAVGGTSASRAASAKPHSLAPYVYPPQTSSPHRQESPAPPADQTPVTPTDRATPFTLVSVLETETLFGGFDCALTAEGTGWHRSSFDGVWNATLRRAFGPNEVSCLLESQNGSTVERIELEAEFNQAGFMEAEMLMQFCQSAQVLMYPAMPPAAFAEAVASKGEWSNDQWALTRIAYPSSGFGLMLRRTGR